MELCSCPRIFCAKMRSQVWRSLMLGGLLVASIFLIATYSGSGGLSQRHTAPVIQTSDEVISSLLGKKLQSYEIIDADSGKSNIYKLLKIPPTTPRQPRYTGPTTPFRTTIIDTIHPQKKSGYIPTSLAPKINSATSNTYQNGVPQQNQQLSQPVLQQQVMPNDLVSYQFQQQQQKIMQLQEQLRQHQLWQQQHQVGNNPQTNQQAQNSQDGTQQQASLAQQPLNQQPQIQPMQQQMNSQNGTQQQASLVQQPLNQQPQIQPMQQQIDQQQGSLPQQATGQQPQMQQSQHQMGSQQQAPVVQQGSGQQPQIQQQVIVQQQNPFGQQSPTQENHQKQLASQLPGQGSSQHQLTSKLPQSMDQPHNPVTVGFANQPFNQQKTTTKSPQEGNKKLEQVTRGMPQNGKQVTSRFPKDPPQDMQQLLKHTQQILGEQEKQRLQPSGQQQK